MAQSQSRLSSFATFEEFFDWERHQETKHELVDGQPVAMDGGSEGHDLSRATCSPPRLPSYAVAPAVLSPLTWR